MKKNATKISLFTVGVMALLSACENSKYPGFEEVEDGLYINYHKPHNEKALTASEGGVIYTTMIFKNDKDSVTFDSKAITPDGLIDIGYTEDVFHKLFLKGLSKLAIGDSVSLILPADSVFGAKIPADNITKFADKGSMITISFNVDTILTKQEIQKEQEKQMEEMKVMMEMRKNEEPKILAKYLEESNIKTKPTNSGLYFIEKVKGKGTTPAMGKLVKVNYTGRLIDGTVFDTSDEATAKEAGLYNEKRPYEPIEFALGTGQVIKGWDEGVAMMKVGSKAQLIIPSQIGYGEQGGGPIPPFSTLIFDVELVGFEGAK